jgi:acyl-CoA synthetase (AMP-forming)/AMP-acid ligase II
MTSSYLIRQPWRDAQAWHASGAWMDVTLPRLLAEHAAATPQRVAIVDGTARVSWAQLERAVRRIATRLAEAGVDRGDAVIVQQPDSAAFIAASLAIYTVAGVAVPLLATSGESEVAAIVERVRARAFLGTNVSRWAPELAIALDPTAHEFWDDGAPPPPLEYEPDADSMCEIMFTSGTTGRPKGAMNSTNTKLAGLRGFLTELRPTADDVWGVVSPMAHNAGWLYSYLPALLTGATSVVVPRGDREHMLDVLEREGVTITFLVPTHATDLLDAWRRHSGRWPRLRLKFVLTGAAASPPGQVLAMADLWGCTPISMYGQTECQANLFSRPDDSPLVAASTVGRACPNAEVALRSPEDGTLIREGVGEVVTRGPLVFLGYFDDQAATSATFSRDGWFRSGDLGEWVGDNIRIVGRIKEVINRGGATLVPEDIEQALDGCAGISEAAVVGLPDQRLGECICVCVVGSATLASIRAHLQQRGVGRALWPDRVMAFERLPRTALGKVQRGQLAREAAERAHKEDA